jgi:hypothetical protein
MVAVHHRKVQFCWSGVTGMTAAFIGGMVVIAPMWLRRPPDATALLSALHDVYSQAAQ